MKAKNVLLVVVILLLAALPAAAATVKVKQNRTPLRAEPTTTSVTIAYYQAGDVLELVDVTSEWYKVRDPQTRREGYIMTRLVELLPGPATPPSTTGAAAPAAAGTQAPTSGRPPAAAPGGSATTASHAARKPSSPGRWTDIAYLAVNGGYQGGASGFSEAFSFPQYLEQATVTTQYPKKDGSAFDVGGAFRVWRNLAAGVSVSGIKRSTSGTVSGSIPSPFFYSASRAVSGTASLQRTETAVHVQAAYVIPAGRRLLVTVAGGPSFFSVKQSLVDTIGFSESYPFETATLNPVTPLQVSKSVVGYNAGLDIGYYFSRHVGAGVLVRYAAGNVSLPSHGTSLSTTIGGFQAGAGLRVRIAKAAPKKTPPKPAPPARPVKK